MTTKVTVDSSGHKVKVVQTGSGDYKNETTLPPNGLPTEFYLSKGVVLTIEEADDEPTTEAPAGGEVASSGENEAATEAA